jgi:transcriptional regulator with XRE-family HTH domain
MNQEKSGLAKRVEWLIKNGDAGNVLKAAERIGVPNATLARIANGGTDSPRAHVLQQIADGYNTTIDWLLNGRGQPPTFDKKKGPAMWEWMTLLNSLNIPPKVRDAVSRLPHTLWDLTILAARHNGASEERAIQAATGWYRLEIETYRRWLRTLVRDLGREGAAAFLIENESAIRAKGVKGTFSPDHLR